MIFHLQAWEVASLPASLSNLGYVGVSFFFTLSGVVLAWGTTPDLPARQFYRRRFARVWPSHAVTLVFAAIVPVVAVDRSWHAAAPNALLLQAWWPSGEVVYGMNGVSWSLSCEAFFYATFPLAVVLLRRISTRGKWACAGLALLGGLLAGVVAPGWALHLPVTRLGEFLLGVAAGLLLREGWRPRIPVAVGIAAVVAGAGVSYLLPKPLPATVMAVPFLVAILAAVHQDLAGKTGWLVSRPMIFAGEASFALYLVHELVIVNVRPYVHAADWMNAAAMVAVAGAAAICLHLAVERPANRLLRGGGRSLALARPAAVANAADS